MDVTTGLTYWYQFESGDVSTKSLYNYANNSYDATLSTNATVSSTQSAVGSSSLYLPPYATYSTYNYVNISTTFTFNTNQILSIAFWYYVVDFTGNDSAPYFFIFYDKNVGSQNNRFTLNLGASSSPWSNISYNYSSTVNNFAPISLASNQSFSNWYHVVYVANSNKQSLYINGTVLSGLNGAALGSIITTATTSAANTIGCYWNGSTTYVEQTSGYIDDFRFYNGTALTATQITALYNLRKSGGSQATISTYTVTRSGTNFTISWTGTNITSVTLTNFTQKINYGQFTTSGQVWSGIAWTATDNYYMTPYDSSSYAGIATKKFTIA